MNDNKIVYAVAKDRKLPLFFMRDSLCVYKLKFENNRVYEYEEFCIENIKSSKWIEHNKIFCVTSGDTTYYILIPKNNMLYNSFIFSYRKPKLNLRIIGRQLSRPNTIDEEVDIVTTPIKRIEKIADNLYKITTGHVYFAIC